MIKQISVIGIVGEKTFIDNPNAVIKNSSLEIWHGSKSGKETYMLGRSTIHGFSTNKIPNDFVGLQYTKNSKDNFYNDSFTINTTNLTKNNDGTYSFGDFNLFFPTIEGVLDLWNYKSITSNVDPLSLFVTSLNGGNNYSTFKQNYENGILSSINDYKNLPNYSINDKRQGEWVRSSLAFSTFDSKIWFTNQPSKVNIKLKDNINLSQIRKDEFINNLEQYIDINFFNTPSQCISNELEKSKLKVYENDKSIILEIDSIGSFIPNYQRNRNKELVNKNWIQNKPMKSSISIKLNQFKLGD